MPLVKLRRAAPYSTLSGKDREKSKGSSKDRLKQSLSLEILSSSVDLVYVFSENVIRMRAQRREYDKARFLHNEQMRVTTKIASGGLSPRSCTPSSMHDMKILTRTSEGRSGIGTPEGRDMGEDSGVSFALMMCCSLFISNFYL